MWSHDERLINSKQLDLRLEFSGSRVLAPILPFCGKIRSISEAWITISIFPSFSPTKALEYAIPLGYMQDRKFNVQVIQCKLFE